jgi:hypothetical protein
MLNREQIAALTNEDLIKWYRSLRETKNSEPMDNQRRPDNWYPNAVMPLSEKQQARKNTFTWNWHEARRELVKRGLRKYDSP